MPPTHTFNTHHTMSEQLTKMIELRNDGLSLSEIAHVLSMKRSEVARRMASADSKTKNAQKALDTRDAVKNLHQQGMSLNDIARTLRLGHRTIRDHLAVAGLYDPKMRPVTPKDKRCSKEGIESNAKLASDIIAELRADVAVLERRKSFKWFQEIEELNPSHKKRFGLVRVVNTGEELRLVIELRGTPTQDHDGVMQRSFKLDQVELALESLLNFIAPPVH